MANLSITSSKKLQQPLFYNEKNGMKGMPFHTVFCSTNLNT